MGPRAPTTKKAGEASSMSNRTGVSAGRLGSRRISSGGVPSGCKRAPQPPRQPTTAATNSQPNASKQRAERLSLCSDVAIKIVDTRSDREIRTLLANRITRLSPGEDVEANASGRKLFVSVHLLTQRRKLTRSMAIDAHRRGK